MGERPDFERDDRPDTAQPAPVPAPPGAVSVHDLVVDDARFYGYHRTAQLTLDRKAFGLRKYGTILHAADEREDLGDIVEELGDAAAYLRRAIARGRDGLLEHYETILEITEELLTMRAEGDHSGCCGA